ncbi:MAG: hypothetical protein ACLUE8_10685 [Lachnospiraceae bacterium]
MMELWHRLRQRGYTRCPESLFRVMRRLGMFPRSKDQKGLQAKALRADDPSRPARPGGCEGRPSDSCIADPELRLFQYTAIDEFTRLRFLAAYPEQSTCSSADFLRKLIGMVRTPRHPGGMRPDGQWF